MKLKSLKVKNFKFFSEFETKIKFDDNVNIIYGDNGVGKSTFIEIFQFLSGLFVRPETVNIDPWYSFFVLPHYENFATRVIDFEPNPIEIEIKFQLEESNLPKFNNKIISYSIKINQKSEVFYERLEILNSKLNDLIFVKNINAPVGNLYDFGNNFEKLEKYYQDNYSRFFKNESFFASFYILNIMDKTTLNESSSFDFIKLIINGFGIFNSHSNKKILEPKDLFFNDVDEMKLFPRWRLDEDSKEDFFKNKDKQLDNYTNFLYDIDESILKVVFEIVPQPSFIKTEMWELFYIKKINGKSVKIPFDLESTGTKSYINYFYFYIKMINSKNKIFFFDEFGSFLNEALMLKVFKLFADLAKKQDSQILLNNKKTSLKNKQKLFLTNNSGNVILRNLLNENHKTNNQEMFLNGIYGGNSHKDEI